MLSAKFQHRWQHVSNKTFVQKVGSLEVGLFFKKCLVQFKAVYSKVAVDVYSVDPSLLLSTFTTRHLRLKLIVQLFCKRDQHLPRRLKNWLLWLPVVIFGDLLSKQSSYSLFSILKVLFKLMSVLSKIMDPISVVKSKLKEANNRLFSLFSIICFWQFRK